ncbi:hypothetical protein [uncultured Aquimarina sp.]|uniref:hypothetical protein n=1 Tax=uncultured Aquimarina sp. TaxID=575652 RepID=UPI002639ACDD|nr:hypothetical protein [uncultured Aquimarina sp.]
MSKHPNIVLIEQLMEQVSESDLYPQLILQLQKDLNRAGIDYEVNKNSTFKELFLEIEQLLLEKINNAFNDFLNLLYAVDVSERDIKNCDSEESITVGRYATYLILKREWQKIYYRNIL